MEQSRIGRQINWLNWGHYTNIIWSNICTTYITKDWKIRTLIPHVLCLNIRSVRVLLALCWWLLFISVKIVLDEFQNFIDMNTSYSHDFIFIENRSEVKGLEIKIINIICFYATHLVSNELLKHVPSIPTHGVW